ncbi:hypothetical protein SCLCIDRAFT_489825 [Scleroderma citrinum Foug A]|uniref:Uncharacterized protein n=1 Tax=Scleroderma citrinum Foug A TaxID=1036808 RepID=A0A0C3EAV5_9AGAM|nr:hypothetical protein SCLCIDRAFT_489825 [Scleroderma citrinum Foug A]
MNNMPDSMDKAFVAVNTSQSVVDQLDTVNSCLRPIKVFISVVQTISNIHPYAKLALCALSWAAQTDYYCTEHYGSIIPSQVSLR